MTLTKILKIAVIPIALLGLTSFFSFLLVNALYTGLLTGPQFLLAAGARHLPSANASNQQGSSGNQSGISNKNNGAGMGSRPSDPMMTNKQCWRYALRVATGTVDDRIAFARKSCGPAQ